MSEGTEIPVPGVHSIDHTADVALEIEAEDLDGLFHRAARGMTHLLLERLPEDTGESRSLRVSSGDLPGLLREWLREILFWYQSDGFVFISCRITRLDRGDGGRAVLEAVVRGLVENDPPPVREIKGVTLHGLAAEPRDDRWYGRVVFDV